MKMLLLLTLLCGCCATRAHKPCEVERVCLRHRADVLKAIDQYPDLMSDVLKTIATLEQEAGGYQ